MTVNDTVPSQPPEREPDVRHALGVTDARTRCGLHLLGRRWTDDPNTPVDCPACRDVLDRADSPLGSSYTPAVLDAIRDTLAAEAPAWDGPDLSDVQASYEQDYRDHLARVRDAAHEEAAADPANDPAAPEAAPGPGDRAWLDSTPWDAFVGPAEPPERRTVGLEVLTDELRAAGDAIVRERAAEVDEDDPILLPASAQFAVVIRTTSGQLVEVFDTDTTWRQLIGHDGPVTLLRDLLSVEVGLCNGGLAGLPAAELLMPGADVLGALSGQPVGAYTAPLKLRADQVDRDGGWVVCSWADEGDQVLVRAVEECGDLTCPWNDADCHVVVTDATEPVHFAPWQDLTVRIPASSEVQA